MLLTFKGGSTLNGSVRSFVAAFNTNTAAGMGCLGWTIVGMIQNKGKFSMIGAWEGAIAGLGKSLMQALQLTTNAP